MVYTLNWLKDIFLLQSAICQLQKKCHLSNMKGHLFIIYFLLTLGPPLPNHGPANNAWPNALFGPSIVEIQGDAFLFGGRYFSNGWKYNSAIYQLTCSSGTCSWSTNNQELKVGRQYHVAIPVPDSFCT